MLERYSPEVLRYFILTSHYRSPLNYSDQHLDNAKNALTTLYTALRGIEAKPAKQPTAFRDRFIAALNNDFATPEAQSVLFDLAHEINRVRNNDPEQAQQLAGELISLGGLLGLLQQDVDGFFQAGDDDGLSAEAIEQMIEQRRLARTNKDFAKADQIRDDLMAQGVILEDAAQGTSWRRE